MKLLQAKEQPERGFTLIELLVTLTIFALVFSALVTGLRSGTRAWRSVRRHQDRTAREARAFRVLQEDLKHLARTSEDVAPLQESSGEEGRESLTITTLCSRQYQRASIGSDWLQVQYLLDSDESGSWRLVRTAQPFVALSPVRNAFEKEVLLSDVEGLTFDYATPDGNVSTWEDAERLPGGVTITMTRNSGTKRAKSVWIPVGGLEAGL